jgi:predicted permease
MRRVFRIPFSTNRIVREVDDELAFHLEMRAQRLVGEGLAPDAARHEALRQFGEVAPIRSSMVTLDQQRERAVRRTNFVGEVQQDVFYAVRTLRRNLGVTAVIVGALAVGIGANTAIFTLIDAVLVRTLPVDRPEQLVVVGNPALATSSGSGSPHTELLSAPLYKDVRDRNQVFTGLLASGHIDRIDARIEGGSAELEHPAGRYVSGNYFAVLGVHALYGRTLEPSADQVTGSAPFVTISYAYWTRRFQNDPAAIGRTILIDGTRMTIIGVTPPSFTGEVVGESADMWLPLSMHDVLEPNRKVLDDRTSNWLLLLGRLAPGVTILQARQQVKSLLEQSILANATPRVAKAFLNRPHRYMILPGARGLSHVRGTFTTPLFTLMAGVALLLCIICANVANLLFARAIARGREMAVRLALGANRARLVRQLMTESAILALLSAVVGLLVAWWGSRALLALAAQRETIPLELRLDMPVLAFTLIVSVLAVALFGLTPALRASRVELATAMRASARSLAGGSLGRRGQRAPLGAVLIAAQVALSVVLLTGAAMLVRSLRNVQSVDTGMDRDHLVLVSADITVRGYKGARLANLVHTIRDRMASLPGVAAVTFSENGIFSGREWHSNVQVPDFTARAPSDTEVATDQVGEGYANGLGATIVAGRDLSAADEAGPPHTVLVNQSLANFYFPGRSAIGQFLRFEDSVSVQIVGVLADTRDHTLTDAPDRRVYFPYLHGGGDSTFVGNPESLRFAVRTKGDPGALVRALREAVRSVDPELPIDGVDPLTTSMRRAISDERLVARLATGFGVLALLLAGVGLYGVMTYAITRRTGEIGLRVALGARQRDIVSMVLLDALRLVGAGIASGLPLALASARLLRAQLHGVPAADPYSIAVAVGMLAAGAVVAVTLPALRASAVSPIEALRVE